MKASVVRLPLCVDLDGTLVRTDVLFESALALVGSSPWLLLLFPFWLLRGKAYLKRQIASRAQLDPATLPYNAEFLGWLREQAQSGRPLILATAADRTIAERIAEHLGIFDEVIATDGIRNIKGPAKASALIDRFGEHGFDYAGDSVADLPVWKAARNSIAVQATRSVVSTIRSWGTVEVSFPNNSSTLAALWRAMRPYQWVKNLLVLTPVLTSHKVFDGPVLAKSAALFVAFSGCASFVYIVNDLLDLRADRLHSKKRHRPFASGACPIQYGIFAAVVLLAAVAWFSIAFLGAAAWLLLLYAVLSLAYSLHLKRKLLADIFTLSALYNIRILAGGLAAGIWLSPWFLSFSGFLFFSLGCTKRASELARLTTTEGHRYTPGRAYRSDDLIGIEIFGSCAGFLAVMVLAMYISSPDVHVLYRQPGFLWLLCPLMLYWICRLWLLVRRGVVQEDPVLFAIKDRLTYVVVLLAAAVVVVATVPLDRWISF